MNTIVMLTALFVNVVNPVDTTTLHFEVGSVDQCISTLDSLRWYTIDQGDRQINYRRVHGECDGVTIDDDKVVSTTHPYTVEGQK